MRARCLKSLGIILFLAGMPNAWAADYWRIITQPVKAPAAKILPGTKLPPGNLAPGICGVTQENCQADAPYCWHGQCLACTHPTSTGDLSGTGYVHCDEGFCTNAGAVAIASIFGGHGEVQVIDCNAVPPAPPRASAQTTHYGLGTQEYTVGSVAVSYEGQQLTPLKCDPGYVAVGIKVKTEGNIIRSVTELDCKPINRLSAASHIPKFPPNPFGSPSGNEASATAESGKALYGFNLHYANELEWDNRLSAIIAGEVDPAEIGLMNNEDYFRVNHEGDSHALGLLPGASAPRVPAICPKKFFVTGIWVLYDSDSIKSVTPTCARVYAPGEQPASVPEGTLGLSKWDEVGYLGGRTVSNATVRGAPGYSENVLVAGSEPYPYENRQLRICPPNMVMTGWGISSGDIINGMINIHCEPIASVFGSCTNGSQERTSSAARPPYQEGDLDGPAPDGGGTSSGGSMHNDYGRVGCAMTGFGYKQQKWKINEEVLGRAHTTGERERSAPGNTQVVSELHSLLSNRDQTQSMQGYNFGQGGNAGYCHDGSLYNCDTSDWINISCPPGSFMVGIKSMGGGRFAGYHYKTNFGAYCRKVEPGPWTEGTNPAPGPGLTISPVHVKSEPALPYYPPVNVAPEATEEPAP